MYAIEFNANVMDGKIEIPSEYKKRFSEPYGVKVILMQQIKPRTVKSSDPLDMDSGFGALSRYANPALWEQEAHAWERAAVEKHEAR